MTDLIKRLREGADHLSEWFLDDVEPSLDCTLPAYLNEAADALERMRGGWFRIDDPENPAPKDGTPVLICRPDWHYPLQAHWSDDKGGHWFVRPGFWPEDNPTHWLPLPSPPEEGR